METLIRLMEMNINTLGSNAREDQVWDSMLTVRAVVAESKKRKLVGSIVTTSHIVEIFSSNIYLLDLGSIHTERVTSRLTLQLGLRLKMKWV